MLAYFLRYVVLRSQPRPYALAVAASDIPDPSAFLVFIKCPAKKVHCSTVGIKKAGQHYYNDLTHIISKNIVDAPLSSSGNAVTSRFVAPTTGMINNSGSVVNQIVGQ